MERPPSLQLTLHGTLRWGALRRAWKRRSNCACPGCGTATKCRVFYSANRCRARFSKQDSWPVPLALKRDGEFCDFVYYRTYRQNKPAHTATVRGSLAISLTEPVFLRASRDSCRVICLPDQSDPRHDPRIFACSSKAMPDRRQVSPLLVWHRQQSVERCATDLPDVRFQLPSR